LSRVDFSAMFTPLCPATGCGVREFSVFPRAVSAGIYGHKYKILGYHCLPALPCSFWV